jgi:hypothetical protein
MRAKLSSLFTNIIAIGLIAIIALMPFHAFFAIVLGSVGIERAIVQSWKEILALVLAFSWLGYTLAKGRIPLKTDFTNISFLLIVVLSLTVTAVSNSGPAAVLYGVKTNLVAIALFFIAQIPFSNKSFLKKNIHWLIIVPGIIVSVLAILQAFFIPPGFLEKIGYNASSIDPRQIVDGSLKMFRAFSTLGGPNQLGAYLILPLVFAIIYSIKRKNYWIGIATIPILAGIALSYSRSAWIGALVAIFTAMMLILNKRQKIIFLCISLVFVVAGSVFVYSQIGKNSRIENVLLHGRFFENRIEGSDQGRIASLLSSADSVRREPLGHGLGSAGPASFQAPNPVITENWYLQIAYEIGIMGLLLYVCAFTGLLSEFFRGRSNPLGASLFAITLALIATNMFLHSWADSTLALMTFSLYGLYKSRSV